MHSNYKRTQKQGSSSPSCYLYKKVCIFNEVQVKKQCEILHLNLNLKMSKTYFTKFGRGTESLREKLWSVPGRRIEPSEIVHIISIVHVQNPYMTT